MFHEFKITFTCWTKKLSQLSKNSSKRIYSALRSGASGVSAGRLGTWPSATSSLSTAGPLSSKARGPYRTIGFKKHGAIAVLMTGTTEFKQRQQYDRHISRLARYYTTSDV